MDALITDGCSRMAYSALRSLSSLGLKVAVADTVRTGMGQWSRLSKGRYVYSPPHIKPMAFMEDITRILKKTGARFLLPGYDETEVLAKHRDMLPPGIILPVADYDSISLANDKYRTARFAEGLGVSVPEIIGWSSMEELKEKLREAGSGVVIKLRRGHSAKGVFYPKNRDEAVAICRGLISKYRLGPDRLPVVQKKVYGEKWGVSCVYYKGRELSSITQQMLRENPASGGTSTYRKTARNGALEVATRKMLGALGYHGIIMAEYKYDPERERYWLIELNARLWGAISHAVAAGADFVKLLYIAETRGIEAALETARPYKLEVYSRWLMGDAMLAASEFRRFNLIRGMRVLMPGATDDYDELKLDDPGALAGEIAYFITRLVRSRDASDHGKLG